MKELPIIFNGEMVNAILDERKTNTRRPFKIQPAENAESPKQLANGNFVFNYDNGVQHKPPYQKGDWIYVRETCRPFSPMGEPGIIRGIEYKADYKRMFIPPLADNEGCLIKTGGKWAPSIHAEKWQSRIWMEAVDVKPQRIQDISEAETIKEGCQGMHHFQALWDSIYKAQGKGFDTNLWVWAIEFKGLSTTGKNNIKNK